MRIAVTVDPYIPVPPRHYGGIERVVEFLVQGLLGRGHEVTLFAHPESRVESALVPYGAPPHVGRMARAPVSSTCGDIRTACVRPFSTGWRRSR